MPSDHDLVPTEQSGPDTVISAEKIDRALGEVEHTLEQMLALAQLSASDLSVDRDALQRTLERLRHRIDQIADTI